MLDGAHAHGLDVTTEAYPYTAGMTDIASAVFSNWETQPPEFFARFLWPPTGERLTRESFERYRRQGGFVAQFRNTEEMVRLAIAHPSVMPTAYLSIRVPPELTPDCWANTCVRTRH